MRKFFTSAVVVLAWALGANHADASTISIGSFSFSGAGPGGTLAPADGEPWFIDCAGTTGPGGLTCPTGDFGWGSPGVAELLTPYLGTTPATDFEITFPDLDIDASQVTLGDASNCAGRETGGTTFCAIPDGGGQFQWSAVLDGPHSIAFFAPPGTSLVNGEDFFVNIFLTNPTPGSLPTSITFNGDWTADATPEPASLVLLGSGIVGLLARRKRRLTR